MTRNHTLRILQIEDVPTDAELVRHELVMAGFDFEMLCVQNEGELFERRELPQVLRQAPNQIVEGLIPGDVGDELQQRMKGALANVLILIH